MLSFVAIDNFGNKSIMLTETWLPTKENTRAFVGWFREYEIW